jgi:hypothetical protein
LPQQTILTEDQDFAEGAPVDVPPTAPPRTRTTWRGIGMVATVLAGLVSPALYFAYVAHYSVNVPQADDWWSIPLVHSALHGRLTLGMLWSQYHESRMFTSNLVVTASAFVGRFDTRSIMFFGAGIYVATFWVLLVVLRRYLSRGLSPVLVLLIGAISFSLANVQNALWAFQLPWFLMELFLVLAVALLVMPRTRRPVYFALAIVASVLASLSVVQGFLVWAVGLVLLLWGWPLTRTRRREVAIWIGAAAVTFAVYAPGFDFSNHGCLGTSAKFCTGSYALWHPGTAGKFFLTVIGNVIPGGYWGGIFSPVDFPRFELVGAAILIAALYVVVQSVRHRAREETLPLPLVLVSFPLAFDLLLTSGRAVQVNHVLGDNRYVLPNLMLVVGIVAYTSRRLFAVSLKWRSWRSRAYLTLASSVAVLVFLGFQIPVSTSFGVHNGYLTYKMETAQARLAVNLDKVPRSRRGCEIGIIIFDHTYPSRLAYGVLAPFLHDAVRDHLSVFQPASYRVFRSEGPPPPSAKCVGRGL